MSTALEKGREAFKEEAYELLDELEASLLELEDRPDDSELIGRIFRAMHTIKGSGGMFGFEDIEKFTHDIETVYDLVRNGEIKVTKELIDLTLAARDQINKMLGGASDAESEQKAREILEGFKGIHGAKNTAEKSDVHDREVSAADQPQEKEAVYWIRFKPEKEIFKFGTNPVFLLNELREQGGCLVLAQTENIPELEKLDPEACYTYWDILLTTSQGENAVKDVFIFVEDDCDLQIQLISGSGTFDTGEGYKFLAECLLEKGTLDKTDITKAVKNYSSAAQPSENQAMKTQDKPETKTSSAAAAAAGTENQKQISSVRVPAERLDSLVNLVGELVILQERLNQTAAMKNDPEMMLIAEENERLVRDLRDTAMNIRMVPIGNTFNKFKRLVRDLEKMQHKDIDLVMEGSETELDKTVIEKLNDPLVHIIRNSIDHGIELPEVREKAGKPAKGTLHLSATHSGADVVIRIQDDGKGLDREAIHRKAVEKGLIKADEQLSDREIFKLIFLPGFSTAESVSSLSGRGVGMDVVRKNIEALRGSITVDSRKNEGTTITLRLPLTLGIIEGMLVRIEDEHFVMPLMSVVDCLEFKNGRHEKGRRILNVRGEMVPYIRLREKYAVPGEVPEIEHVVIARVNEEKIGFVVDEIVGEQQIVIKSLGKMYKDVDGLSGATIMGDGTVALIMDTQRLAQSVIEEERTAR